MLGLVLEGGAMRAIYTAGVLDVFMENELRTDAVFGVSAGAIHGSVYLSNQPGRTIRYYKKYRGDKRFMSFFSLLTTGSIVGEQFCYHDIPDHLDPFDYDTFAASPAAYYAVCTDLETGAPLYRRCTDLRREMDYLLASASMPFVSKIVQVDGKKLLDGGVADSIPIEAARKMGYERNIVVLTQYDGYRKSPQKPGLAKLIYRKYPQFTAALLRRHTVYNDTLLRIGELEQNGEIFVIRPSKNLGIKRTEKDVARLEAQYQLGRSDAEKALPALRQWMAKQTAGADQKA